MESILKRREIPIGITALVGIILLLDYFVKFNPLQSTAATITSWSTVLTGVIIAIGLCNLTIVQGNRVLKKAKGQWPFSLWLVVSMYATIIIGLWAQVPWGMENDTWRFIYTYINTPITQTISSLFGFYVISAAFHSLRAKNAESMLFMLSALAIFFWAAPIGSVIWPGFSTLGNWLMTIFTAGVYRGVLLGISLGLISYGVRVVIGRERGYLSRGRMT